MNFIRKNRILSLIVALALLYGVFAAYTRFTEPRNSGTIYVLGLPDGAKIFVDNERVYPDTFGNEGTLRVTEGERDLLVAADNYWPWLKRITVFKNGETAVYPFILPKAPEIEPVPENDPEYEALKGYLEHTELPTAATPLFSKDKRVSIYLDGNNIVARWESNESPHPAFCTSGTCVRSFVALESTQPITDIDFLKSRNDIVVVAVPDGIYALELDTRGLQNFEPIYNFPGATFYKAMDGSLYIGDGERILWMPLRDL